MSSYDDIETKRQTMIGAFAGLSAAMQACTDASNEYIRAGGHGVSLNHMGAYPHMQHIPNLAAASAHNPIGVGVGLGHSHSGHHHPQQQQQHQQHQQQQQQQHGVNVNVNRNNGMPVPSAPPATGFAGVPGMGGMPHQQSHQQHQQQQPQQQQQQHQQHQQAQLHQQQGVAQVAEKVPAKRGRKPNGEKKIRDPNAPKRPPSAYILYQNEVRDQLRQTNPGMAYRDILNTIANQWKALSTEQRKVYEEAYQFAQNRFKEEEEQYNATGAGAAAIAAAAVAATANAGTESDDSDESSDDDAAVAAQKPASYGVGVQNVGSYNPVQSSVAVPPVSTDGKKKGKKNGDADADKKKKKKKTTD